ncbi:MAG: hypothetical protein CMA63_06205 [Euryarchaeota archaeon]|jgi:translation initiation factor IF-3|nr:hypothetical protein [Euryarchaeota archaeon]|tara:strand:+ start:8947 stop:9213 length:267 start_codon:yes stop_codon:yes gene_type:complete
MAKTTKEINLTVNIASNDLERKAKQALKFRDKGLGVNVKLRLKRGREADRTGDALQVVNRFVGLSETPDSKVNPLKWSDNTLTTFLHP